MTDKEGRQPTPRQWIKWVLLFLVAVVGSAMAWVFLSGGSGEPSTELTTPPIVTNPPTTNVPSAGGSTSVPASPPGTGETQVFVIDSAQSVATYEIDEILRGNPNHVVGTTSEVAGQFELNPDNPSGVLFSEILVNARTFVTDSSTRDRIVRGTVVLNSARDEFEFIRFSVTDIQGLPPTLTVGQAVDLTVTGDLTIRGTTNAATFDVTVTLVDDATISGSATTVVLRSDYGIGIPSVASVAGVTDEVTITLDFVALSD